MDVKNITKKGKIGHEVKINYFGKFFGQKTQIIWVQNISTMALHIRKIYSIRLRIFKLNLYFQ